MITFIFTIIIFLGGVYVGTRWADKLKDIYYSIISK